MSTKLQIEIAIKNVLHSGHSSIHEAPALFLLISSAEFLVDFYMGSVDSITKIRLALGYNVHSRIFC